MQRVPCRPCSIRYHRATMATVTAAAAVPFARFPAVLSGIRPFKPITMNANSGLYSRPLPVTCARAGYPRSTQHRIGLAVGVVVHVVK